MRASWAGLGAALALIGSTASAQVPPDIAAKIRASGQSMDPSVGPLYTAIAEKEPWAGVTVLRDIAYGADPQQWLDVYAPASPAKKRPVLLFVHGGGFTGGSKHGAFYPDNITVWAVRAGMIGVNINYRLAPKDAWPAGAKDLAAAIAWVRAHIADHGGDPDRIILWGHSAGANHVADYVAHPEVRGAEAAAVRGAILLSPNYPAEAGSEPHAYYGTDPRLKALPGIIEGLRASPIPLFIAAAQFDPEPMRFTARTMHDALCQTPARCPALLDLADHNHFSEGMAVGTADQSLTGPLRTWLAARW